MDTHHGACYRAFNANRDIVAHNLRPETTPPEFLGDGSWAEIQRRAKEMGDSNPFNPLGFIHTEGEFGSLRESIHKHTSGGDCTFGLRQ